MTIYLIPGLANDKRIFRNLARELGEYNLVYLEHLPHLSHEETISQYAIRLIQRYQSFEVDSVIIGLSLGGLIAIEMSKILNFRKVILLSTVKHKNELPLIIKFASKLKIYLPPSLIKSTIKTISILFNVTNRTGAEYLSKIIKDSEEQHMVWAQKAVISWDNVLIPNNYLHIHGTSDEIFPISCVKPTHRIKKGTHYMVMDRAQEIASIIKNDIVQTFDRSSSRKV